MGVRQGIRFHGVFRSQASKVIDKVVVSDPVHPDFEWCFGPETVPCLYDFFPGALVEIIGGGGITYLSNKVTVKGCTMAGIKLIESLCIALRISLHEFFVGYLPHECSVADTDHVAKSVD